MSNEGIVMSDRDFEKWWLDDKRKEWQEDKYGPMPADWGSHYKPRAEKAWLAALEHCKQGEPSDEVYALRARNAYLLAQLSTNSTPPQPPCDNEYVADGCELFAHAMPKSEPPCKPVEIPWMVEGIRAITFRQFVEYGKSQAKELVNGMPWSFTFDGFPVTHENDSCYLICDHPRDLRFTPDDILIKFANDILDIADEKITLRDYNFRNGATPQPTTDISELVQALTKARAGLSDGLWDCGPGQDEHEQCDLLIDELDIVIAKHTVKA